jgi:hypothetical protein
MSDEMASSRWSAPLLVRAAVVTLLCLGAGAAVGFGITHQPALHRGTDTPPAAGRPSAQPDVQVAPTPDELRLLAPLGVGASLGDYTIDRITPVEEGVISIRCTHGPKSVTLQVALASPEAPAPPATSGRYAVYYSGRAAGRDAMSLCTALAQALDANASVPVPSGLSSLPSER